MFSRRSALRPVRLVGPAQSPQQVVSDVKAAVLPVVIRTRRWFRSSNSGPGRIDDWRVIRMVDMDFRKRPGLRPPEQRRDVIDKPLANRLVDRLVVDTQLECAADHDVIRTRKQVSVLAV